MNTGSRWMSRAALASFALVAAPAAAQTTEPQLTGTGATYSVTFIDDALNALPENSVIPRIAVRPRVARTMLLRPRASFVSEMLKSVESM